MKKEGRRGVGLGERDRRVKLGNDERGTGRKKRK